MADCNELRQVKHHGATKTRNMRVYLKSEDPELEVPTAEKEDKDFLIDHSQ